MKNLITALMLTLAGAAATAQTTNNTVNAQEQTNQNRQSPARRVVNQPPARHSTDTTARRWTSPATRTSVNGKTNYNRTRNTPQTTHRANSSNTSTTIRPDDAVK